MLSRKKTVLLAGAVTAFVVAFSTSTLLEGKKTTVHNGIPVPFAADGGSLAGRVTFTGQRNGIDVYEVTYKDGEIFEALQPDRIYLVHIPNLPDVLDVPLDTAMAAVSGTGRIINYYGYRYTDPAATLERRDINALLFKDRFPGQFFASAKARAQDATYGNQLLAFEQQNGITFRKTDGSAGSVRMDPAGALYVFIVNEDNGARLFARNGGFCGNGIIEPGEDCDDADTNNDNACSNTCKNNIPIPFDEATAGTGTKLALSVQTTANAATVIAGQTGVTLMRIDAGAAEAVRLTKLVATAETGSLSNAISYRLMTDTNADGKPDTVIRSGVTPVAGTLTFDAINGSNGQAVTTTAVSLFIVADISDTPSSPYLQLKLATAIASYAEGRRESPAVPLAGIRTNGTCTEQVCQISVITRTSVLVTISIPAVCGNSVVEAPEQCDDGANNGVVCSAPAGGSCQYCSLQCETVTVTRAPDPIPNLFVTAASVPNSTHQLLAGALGDTILTADFSAQDTDIDVTDIVFTATGADAMTVGDNVDRLELYKASENTPFAVATVAACGSQSVPAHSFCATIAASQLLVASGTTVRVNAKPLMNSDTNGAVSGSRFGFMIGTDTASGSVRATASGTSLSLNNGDGTADHEVLIGRSSAGPDQAIVGTVHTVVLSKLDPVDGIANSSPDADGTAVPTGVSQLGRFDFKTLANTNSNNGLNKWTLSGVIFTIDATNIQFDDNSFAFYNLADNTATSPCSVDGSSSDATFHVICTDITASTVDTAITSNTTQTFVLQADILNAQVSVTSGSVLQVSIRDFSDPDATGFGVTGSHIRWFDADAASATPFVWVENASSFVRSTIYGLAAPECGNSVTEAGEQCDDGNTSNTDACTNACVAAVCGDGFVHDGVEECDDGNTDETDDCDNSCHLTTPIPSF